MHPLNVLPDFYDAQQNLYLASEAKVIEGTRKKKPNCSDLRLQPDG